MGDTKEADASSEKDAEVEETEVDETTEESAKDSDGDGDGKKLGPKGEQALERIKAKLKAEKEARRKAEKELDAERTQKASGEAEADAEKIRREATAEAERKANERIVRAEIKAAAGGKLSDPGDAVRFLDVSQFELDADGNVDEDEVADAIADLLKKKPYLAAQGGSKDEKRGPKADKSQGARGGSATPSMASGAAYYDQRHKKKE